MAEILDNQQKVKLPIKCTQFDLQDLQQYANQVKINKAVTPETSSEITNFLTLKSELYIAGLKTFRDALQSSDITMEQLKTNYSKELLRDLENLTGRQEFTKKESVISFKSEFYAEIFKAPAERSSEITEFLTYCSKLADKERGGLTVVETISAKTLLDLDQFATTTELKKSLDGYLADYKEKAREQTEKDIGSATEKGRDCILFKDQSSKTIIIDIKELDKIDTLTGEQKDFIKSSWHQGTYGVGNAVMSSFTGNYQKEVEKLYPEGNHDLNRGNRNFLFIDTSKKGVIEVSSRANIGIFSDLENRQKSDDYAEIVMKVDVSALKGEEYIPGCASNEPKITICVSEFHQDIRYEIPKDLKNSVSQDHDRLRQDLIQDSTKCYIDEILKNGNNSNQALDWLINNNKNEDPAEFILNKVINLKEFTVDQKKLLLKNITQLEDRENFFDDAIKTRGSEISSCVTIGVLNKANDDFQGIINDIADDFKHPLYNVALKISNQVPNYIIELEAKNLPAEGFNQRLAIEYYKKVESNPEKIKNFVNDQFSKYCEQQTITTLDEETKERLKEGMASILSPICSEDKKKEELLNQNVGKILRQCAKEVGTKMDFNQWCKANIIDPVKMFFGGKSKLQEIVEQHPDLVSALQSVIKKESKEKSSDLPVSKTTSMSR